MYHKIGDLARNRRQKNFKGRVCLVRLVEVIFVGKFFEVCETANTGQLFLYAHVYKCYFTRSHDNNRENNNERNNPRKSTPCHLACGFLIIGRVFCCSVVFILVWFALALFAWLLANFK